MTAMRRPLSVAAALLSTAFGVAAGPAFAHGLESSLERVSDLTSTFELKSQFSTGVPAAGAAVTLVAPAGQAVAVGHTDAQGQLRFRLPAVVDGSWELRVDQGPGHRDYLELPGTAAERGSVLSSAPGLNRFPPLASMAWGGMALVLVGVLVRRPDRPRR
jgi:nickel transport protein